MRFFDSLKALFPRSRLFQLGKDTNLYKLADGTSVVAEDMRTDAEKSYLDIFPEETRKLEEWEKEFSIQFTSLLTKEQRRSILSALWKMRYGAATTDFLEEMLSSLVPGIKVVENNPVRNPTTAESAYLSVCGNINCRCGTKRGLCGFHIGDRSFIPDVLKNDSIQLGDIPQIRRYWETCFFVCGGVNYNSKKEIVAIKKISIDSKWRKFIEYIILSVKPIHMTALLFVNWDATDEEEVLIDTYRF